jgi:hypothetical protein
MVLRDSSQPVIRMSTPLEHLHEMFPEALPRSQATRIVHAADLDQVGQRLVTVADLLDEGLVRFAKRRNIGRKSVEALRRLLGEAGDRSVRAATLPLFAADRREGSR